jgi:hypothetical protein
MTQQLMFADRQVSGQRQPNTASQLAEPFYIHEKPIGSNFGGDFGLSVQCPKCGRPGCESENAHGVKAWVHAFSLATNAKGNPVVRKHLFCKETP